MTSKMSFILFAMYGPSSGRSGIFFEQAMSASRIYVHRQTERLIASRAKNSDRRLHYGRGFTLGGNNALQ